jgi:hypothetical protein
MNITEDIKDARKKLEKAEQASNPLEKAKLFKEGIQLLYACMTEEDISPAEKNIISQLRFTYTRLLLSKLLLQESFLLEDRDILYSYFGIFFTNPRTYLINEVFRALQENPDLKQPFQRFFIPLIERIVNTLSEPRNP